LSQGFPCVFVQFEAEVIVDDAVHQGAGRYGEAKHILPRVHERGIEHEVMLAPVAADAVAIEGGIVHQVGHGTEGACIQVGQQGAGPHPADRQP